MEGQNGDSLMCAGFKPSSGKDAWHAPTIKGAEDNMHGSGCPRFAVPTSSTTPFGRYRNAWTHIAAAMHA